MSALSSLPVVMHSLQCSGERKWGESTVHFTAVHCSTALYRVTEHYLTALQWTLLHCNAQFCTVTHCTQEDMRHKRLLLVSCSVSVVVSRLALGLVARTVKKNPAYGRHQLSRPMRIVGQIQI